MPEVQKCIEEEGVLTVKKEIVNVDRCASARVAGAVAAKYGDAGFAGSLNLELEGTADHCCEYMTGGCVVVLGKVGRNVGAGMTGGIGYFLDEDDTFASKVNGEIVSMQRVATAAGEVQLKGLIEEHVAKTGSPK